VSLANKSVSEKDNQMKTEVTATFQTVQPVTLTATTPDELDEIVEMFFANGAIFVSSKGEGIV
jgi:hypothetical protein